MAYVQLSKEDRVVIQTLLAEGKSDAYIAGKIGKHRSTVGRERKRNKTRGGIYDAAKANHKAYLHRHTKKKPCTKIRMHRYMERVIRKQLLEGWSAEQVSMKIQAEYNIPLSGSSIRRYIHSKKSYDLKMILREKRLLKQYRKRHKKGKVGIIPHRVSIDVRPLFVSSPLTSGHYECDFIESTKDDKTVFLTLIDKRSRWKIAVRLEDKQAWRVYLVLLCLIHKYGIKTITFDNDLSFARHYELGIPTYFCDPYASWQKGQIEKANRGWRKRFPKGTKLKNISQEELNNTTMFLNHLPMKCLGGNTPRETYFNCRIRYLPIIP